MEDNLDFKVVINNKSEYESLYSWSINEVGEDGDRVQQHPLLSEDYVQFRGSSLFLTKKLSYQSTFKLEPDVFLDDSGELYKEETEIIWGKMFPDNRRSYTNYSIFGTNRTIESLDLKILGVDKGKESCRCRGFPSYTINNDIEDITTDDYCGVIVYVSHNKFKELKDSITNKSISSLQVNLGGVNGFYSPWSPVERPLTLIKILTTDQPVEIPENFDLEIPKLGIINEIELIHNITQELVISGEDED